MYRPQLHVDLCIMFPILVAVMQDEIRPEDKEALRKLCGVQSHYLVGGAVC